MENKLYEAASRLPETNLDFDAIQPAKKPTAIKTIRRAASLAACAILLISIGFGTYAVVAEAKEYNAAVRFFDEYDLSTEGLSRSQIKAVYRDIITESFTYSETAEVIFRSLTQEQVEGFEIQQGDPAPEDLENLWNYKTALSILKPSNPDNIRYDYDIEYKTRDDKYGSLVFDKSYLEKYSGDTLVWRIAITEFQIWGCSVISDGVIAYGKTPTLSSSRYTYAWLAKVSDDGEILWMNTLPNGFSEESIFRVLENKDGSYAVFSRGDMEYLCFSQYTNNGELKRFHKNKVGRCMIYNAARFGDGYIVQLGDNLAGEYSKIVKVDSSGIVTDTFSYDSDDSIYRITDMIEFNGNIYLSAYATPQLSEDEPTYGSRKEIARILDYCFSQKKYDISSEELTPIVRENYTAVLLICSPDSGIPQEFYSVKGSLGGELAINDSGELVWDVESITHTYFSPATSFFTIGGSCYVYRYYFNADGTLTYQEKTGGITHYAR